MPNVIVTSGPTYEPLDEVRRLTNHSTGRLGTELANHLQASGFAVTQLKGYYATFPGSCKANRIIPFTTTDNLASILGELAQDEITAVYHAAAVSDFRFDHIQPESGHESSSPQGKWSTRVGALVARLVPTQKIIANLRGLFPHAQIVGWKYEVDGDRRSAIEKARAQIDENQTDYSIVNGPAYGPGFGIVSPHSQISSADTHENLYEALSARLKDFIKSRKDAPI